MNLLLLALAVLIGTGIAALFRRRNTGNPSWLAAGGVVVASVLAAIPAIQVLMGAPTMALRLPWAVPFGEFSLELDALSAWFLLPILVLSALSAVYGTGYLAGWSGRRTLGPSWLFFNLLVASMMVVVLAANAVLFIVAWEIMALASFFLVTFDDEKEEVRAAGWVYLVATHLGTAFLFIFFVLAGRTTGSFDFDTWAAHGLGPDARLGLLFVLAVIGFGVKAGFMPLHVWLPEAHPAAPSHVSALMSGVMIKTGIYGILRALTFLGPPPAWWGWVLIGVGLSSGILGVLFALAQHDLKRLLAYHSVENIGIIALGMGVGLLGISLQAPALVVLGFGGGLLHVVNHALFKGLLFLGAGSVLHGSGTREIDELGGLLKKMPWTGVTFLVGAVAICGLPPLNGFVSELLIFTSAFLGVTTTAKSAAVAGLAVIIGLALIGGLAAACFTKAFGIVFLGEPRSEHATHAHESGWAMRWPMVLLAGACFGVTLAAPVILRCLGPVLEKLSGWPQPMFEAPLTDATRLLVIVALTSLALVSVIVAVALLRHLLLAGRRVSTAGTWDCGYARPAARMQYTASSYAQPFTRLFHPVLQTHVKAVQPDGLFPQKASFATETSDLSHAQVYRPAFLKLSWGLARLRWLQHGKVQLYILYIAITLLALIVWKLH